MKVFEIFISKIFRNFGRNERGFGGFFLNLFIILYNKYSKVLTTELGELQILCHPKKPEEALKEMDKAFAQCKFFRKSKDFQFLRIS